MLSQTISVTANYFELADLLAYSTPAYRVTERVSRDNHLGRKLV